MTKIASKSKGLTAKVRASLNEGVVTLHQMKKEKKKAADTEKSIQTVLLELFSELEIGEWSVEDGAHTINAQRVQGSSDQLDVSGFKKWLTARNLWLKCSTRTLDMKKVESLVASGTISAADMKKFMSKKENAPYIRTDVK